MRCGRYAAIDIGTVTCRMLVVDADESGLHELTREYAITNLGEGVDATGELKPEAIDRVVRAIDGFLAVRDSLSTPDHPVVRTVAVATSAARDARNAADFAARLRERGIELSVIPGSREAALSFSGASIDFSGERLMVVDVGGGSTEVVMGVGGAEPLCAHSFNVGCRRVTEKFLASDPPAPEELARARAWIREQRMRVVGLDPKRAPVMVAGLLILLEVLDFTGIDAFTVSETDILHGITLAVSHEACEKSCL